ARTGPAQIKFPCKRHANRSTGCVGQLLRIISGLGEGQTRATLYTTDEGTAISLRDFLRLFAVRAEEVSGLNSSAPRVRLPATVAGPFLPSLSGSSADHAENTSPTGRREAVSAGFP